VVERFEDFPNTALGRFAIRDMNKTIGIGQVLSVKEKQIQLK
jgi:elongation factor 1-alpha